MKNVFFARDWAAVAKFKVGKDLTAPYPPTWFVISLIVNVAVGRHTLIADSDIGKVNQLLSVSPIVYLAVHSFVSKIGGQLVLHQHRRSWQAIPALRQLARGVLLLNYARMFAAPKGGFRL